MGSIWKYGELPIAVYSADKPAEFQGKEVAIGKEVIESLHENKQLGWQFVDSKEQLEDGVRSESITQVFTCQRISQKILLSFTSGDIKKPKIEYTVNEKSMRLHRKSPIKEQVRSNRKSQMNLSNSQFDFIESIQ